VVLQQRKILNASVFSLKPYLTSPSARDRSGRCGRGKKEQEERKKQKEIREGTKIIVIDPGTERRPGAIGLKERWRRRLSSRSGRKLPISVIK